MTLYLIGIGLNDEKDITLKGLEIVKKCKKVYLDNYTSKLNCNIKDLERLYKKKIILANRDFVENKTELILKGAKSKNVAFLVIGDIFSSTTHINLKLMAEERGIKCIVVHNASIFTAVGIIGLQVCNFGKVTSIPFENKNVITPLKVLKENKNMHTLFLLDLDPENNRYMTVNEALNYLLSKGMKNRLCVGCAALGSLEPEIKFGKAKELLKEKFTKFPQCLIVPGKMHFMEEEFLKRYKKF